MPKVSPSRPHRLALQREPCRNGLIHVGELVWLDLAIRYASSGKDANIGDDLLLPADIHSGSAGVTAHRRDVGRSSRDLREVDGILEAPHAAAGEISIDQNPAGFPPERVAALDFADPLDLRKMWVEIGAVRHYRKIEQASTYCPIALIPFDGRAIGIAPGIGGVIEGPGIDQRPVEEIVARVVGIVEGVENVGDAELANGNHQPVGSLRSRKLVDAGLHFLCLATKVDCLPHKHPRDARIRYRETDLVSFTAGEARDAERAAETESLVDLRVDPELGALPQPQTGIEGSVPGLPSMVGIEAVRTVVRRVERSSILVDEGGLRVQREPTQIQCGDSFGENLRIDALAANPIIEPKTNALNREIGIEPLRGVRKVHVSHPELRVEIFEPRGPVRTQREFYPSAG